MQKSIVLIRRNSERTSDQNVNAKVDELLARATQTGPASNWAASPSRNLEVSFDNDTHLYVFKKKVTFNRISGHRSTADKHWKIVLSRLIRAGLRQNFGKYPWLVEGEGVEEVRKELELKEQIPSRPSKEISEIKDIGNISIDPKDYFDHIYGRADQIKIIQSAILAGKESDWQNRFHCVLFGPPGCGKTDLLASTGHMLGKENSAYLKLDATSTTEAGAQKILLEASHIPPVLIVEEVEKTDEKSLRWLLGILDHRAEIRKTNFHIGTKARNVKMLCLATVNDLGLFKKVMSGALASRFAHEIYCPRPDRIILEKILEREVYKVNGKREWIEPTLQYCYDEKKIDDPRKIVPVCLCGRDSLLDGSYQKSLTATQMPSV
jgi:hypothetical protein